MRPTIKSETDAFRFVYGLALVGGVSLLVGHLIGPVVGILLFTVIGLGVLFWDATRPDPASPASLREAAHAGRERGGRAERRALVVANEAFTGDALWDELLQRRKPRPVIEVIAPVLQSKTHFVTTDIDKETEDARRRLEETLDWARGHGLEATGEIGDPIDPFEAIADELRRYDLDEVILATHRPERANWLETDLLERMREQLDIPLTHVMIDRDADRVEVEWPSIR